MVIGALLSAVHLLTLALGLGAVFLRGRALAGPLDEDGWHRLLTDDNIWGVAAGLWIVSGLGRVFYGGKESSFYWRNGFFCVRSARRRGTALPRFSIDAYRRINSAEVVLVVTIVFVATLMARGAWLF